MFIICLHVQSAWPQSAAVHLSLYVYIYIWRYLSLSLYIYIYMISIYLYLSLSIYIYIYDIYIYIHAVHYLQPGTSGAEQPHKSDDTLLNMFAYLLVGNNCMLLCCSVLLAVRFVYFMTSCFYACFHNSDNASSDSPGCNVPKGLALSARSSSVRPSRRAQYNNSMRWRSSSSSSSSSSNNYNYDDNNDAARRSVRLGGGQLLRNPYETYIYIYVHTYTYMCVYIYICI